jgi:hypothetical protein
MNVYEIVNETGQFCLLVFQREYEHENGEFGLGLFIKIMALDVNCPSKLTFLKFEFYNSRYGLNTEGGIETGPTGQLTTFSITSSFEGFRSRIGFFSLQWTCSPLS